MPGQAGSDGGNGESAAADGGVPAPNSDDEDFAIATGGKGGAGGPSFKLARMLRHKAEKPRQATLVTVLLLSQPSRLRCLGSSSSGSVKDTTNARFDY